MPAPLTLAPSIHFLNWRTSPQKKNSGSTSTALSARPRSCLNAGERCCVVSSVQLCFRFGNSDELQTRLVDEMMKDGYALLTSTELRGAVSLRLCTINPRTTEEDIIGTVERLDRFARQ